MRIYIGTHARAEQQRCQVSGCGFRQRLVQFEDGCGCVVFSNIAAAMLLEQQWTRQQLLNPSTATRVQFGLGQYSNNSPTQAHPSSTSTNAKRRTRSAKRRVSILNPLRWRNTATRRHPNPKFEDEDEDEAPGEARRLTRAQTTYRAYRATQTREVSSSQSRMRFDTREQTPGVSGPDKGYRGT